MCMKNLNLSTIFCDSDLSEVYGSVQLGKFIKETKAIPTSDEEKFMIDDLTIVTIVSAISDSNDPNLQKKYDILWTLEPLNANENDRIQLAADTLDVNKNKIEKNMHICRSFSNQILKFTLRNLALPKVNENYFLKVFLREKNETKWQIQSINSIKVINQ